MRRATLLVALLALGCDETLLDPMAFRQPRARAFQPSALFEDGKAMRPLPQGTVAREWQAASLDAQAQRLPVALTRALLERGQQQYGVFCALCHGPAGDGNSLVARQMSLRPPPSLHAYSDRPVGYLYQVITQGFGLMASYAPQIAPQDRWAVVAYVRALQVSQNARITDVPPEARTVLQSQGAP